MSSRALRKIQQQEEERRRAEALKVDAEDDGSEGEEETSSKPAAVNAFDLLNSPGDEIDEEISHNGSEDEEQKADVPQVTPRSQKSKAKNTKKKNKGNKVANTTGVAAKLEGDKAGHASAELDEIDLALQSLSTKDKSGNTASTGVFIDETNAQLFRLLAVEAKHLNALNEMKRLFGSVVTENNDDRPANTRRRGRGPQHVDLGGALTARYSPVSKGQGLKGLALKRNPFILGKEEWPQATSGGLGMELVEKMEDGTVEYRFIHNNVYQGTQREFESCVASMDPQRLINMLVFNREYLRRPCPRR